MGGIFTPASGGGFSNMAVFTSSGTWTVPAGVTKAKVTVVGGGARGAVCSGCVAVPGSSGGTSSFGAFCSASGGSGGTPGGGGIGSGGDLNIRGGRGDGSGASSFLGGANGQYGGGGAAGVSNHGGGAGGCAIKIVTGLTPGGTISVTVGAAGSSGAGTPGAGVVVIEY